jgi:GNAT superfamily N-acetyltransferase
MMLTIRPVDPEDEKQMTAFAGIQRESELHESAHATPFTFEESREHLRNTDPSDETRGFLGYDGEVPVAAGVVELFLIDNADKAWIGVDVLPAHRNRGHGSAMFDHVVQQVRDEGRRQVMTGITAPAGADGTYPARRFLEKRGFIYSQEDVHRMLSLPADETVLDRLWSDSEKHFADYTFANFEGLPPEEMRDAYCVLLNQIVTDAPMGLMTFEEGRMTPEGLAKREEASRAAQRTTYVTVALDGDRVPVAHNVLVVPDTDPGKIFNHDTMVRRDHRGHRLGYATKILNLRWVAPMFPDRTEVHTWNAASNSFMIAVNDAMGFRPVSHGIEFFRDL